MEEISSLSEAFQNFTVASRSLETSYGKLQEKVLYLTEELAEKNSQLKAALSDTEEVKDYLKGILQGLAEAIVVLDPDKNITMLNNAAEKMLGIDREDVLGRPFDNLDFTVERDGADTILLANGRRYHVILSCSEVLDGAGRVRGQVILYQDITRSRELEYLHERDLRLIAMGEMAAKIVHEIRSPLCSIELYAGMLAKDLEETRHTGLAKGISNGTRSLNNILTNMLFFAKPHKPTFGFIALNAVLDDALSLLRPMLDARGVVLDRQSAYSPDISGDAELLKQVFMNIIINAAHVTPAGGKIELSVKKDGTYVLAEVTDEGTGIRPEDRERIFDPFYSTKDKGTGLGLAIASKIMQAHGGVIRVRSEFGKGSSFQLCFPEKEECMAATEMSKVGIF